MVSSMMCFGFSTCIVVALGSYMVGSGFGIRLGTLAFYWIVINRKQMSKVLYSNGLMSKFTSSGKVSHNHASFQTTYIIVGHKYLKSNLLKCISSCFTIIFCLHLVLFLVPDAYQSNPACLPPFMVLVLSLSLVVLI